MNSDLLKNFVQKAKRRLVGKEPIVTTAKIKIIPNEDENLKDKVVYLMSQEEIVTNPVHYLLDDKKFKNMDDEQRERYLLSTLDKYNKLREQMENMTEFNSRCM